MVMSQTLLTLLKQQDPAAIIDVLAPAWSKALLARMPEVHASLVSPFAHKQLSLYQRYLLGKQLKAGHYDQVIILPNSFKSALAPFWSHIPQRTAWTGEWPRSILLTDARTLDKEKLPLMIQRFAALGLPKDAPLPAILPRPCLAISQQTLSQSLNKQQIQRSSAPLLVLAPGAEFGPSKRWPAAYFAEVAKMKLAQGWDVWMFGSANDASIGLEIQQQVENRITNFIGKTNLAEAVDLISLATVVVSNDSGLMHIAAALNRPLVAIYGSTSPKFTPPLGDKVKILELNLSCSPCFKRDCPLQHWRCMLDLKPQQVLSALDELL
jgi:heptosyltransferase-2